MIRSAPNAAAAVAEHLRDQIVQGLLRPGVLLRQEAVAAELGVSRIPVFHALAKLESEGLIEISPNRAAFVSTPSARRCLEIFDLRRLLEGDMLARAIGQHTQRSLRAVRAVMLELEDDEGPRAWIAADRRYYAALCGPAERDLTLGWARQQTAKGRPLAERHAGVLALVALLQLAPYDVPAWLPEVLETLGSFHAELQPIKQTVSKAFADFKRTHQDNWVSHRERFTPEQQDLISDMLVSPSFYA